MVDPTYIYIGVLVVGSLSARELMLHVRIAKMQRDIAWIVKWINGSGNQEDE